MKIVDLVDLVDLDELVDLVHLDELVDLVCLVDLVEIAFHQIRPLGQFSLVVAMSIYIYAYIWKCPLFMSTFPRPFIDQNSEDVHILKSPFV